MSTLQYVILLVVILLSPNINKIVTIIRRIKRWSFRRKVARLESALEKHCQKCFFLRNGFEGKIAICLTDDWSASSLEGGFDKVEPTFVFYQRDSKKIEKALSSILGDFLFELCKKELPRNYFSGKQLQWAIGKDFTQERKTLHVPQKVMPFDVTLSALKFRLEQYLRVQVK